MKKTLFTLRVNDYAPDVCELTFPLLKQYAHKIGAEFFVITERKYPEMPPAYEKLQIYDLGREMKNDWNLYVDADALVHPDLPDVTTLIQKDTVAFHGKDFASVRWRFDKYFLRDGRQIGACNWFALASDWCLDLWHPLEDMALEEAVENIFPITSEKHCGLIDREHLLDDYVLSRNIAKYGLKHAHLLELFKGKIEYGHLWHDYVIPVEEKVVKMHQVLEAWSQGYLIMTTRDGRPA